jgi:DNA-binding transcriptional LysR family regulator
VSFQKASSMTDRLGAMKTFVRVVETGSFTAVARELGCKQPAVSKQIGWLEAHVGNRLVERTTRRLLFTDRALEYYEQCKTIVDAVDVAERSVRNEHVELSGELRISASIGFGSFVIAPQLSAFLARYPAVTIDLRMSDDYVDLVADGIDIAFRLGPPASDTSASRLLGRVHPILVASKLYCDAHGEPDTLAALSSHSCIVISGRPTAVHWQFEEGAMHVDIPVSGSLRTDSGMGARAMVLADAGIALQPRWLFADEVGSGRVVQLLPTKVAVSTLLHAITPFSRRHSLKVQAFLEVLGPHFMRQLS